MFDPGIGQAATPCYELGFSQEDPRCNICCRQGGTFTSLTQLGPDLGFRSTKAHAADHMVSEITITVHGLGMNRCWLVVKAIRRVCSTCSLQPGL